MSNGTKKTLFLLSKEFPYGRGEQYIGHEIQFLAKAFHRIVIYPNDVYGKPGGHDKALPANVEILNLNVSLAAGEKNTLSDYFYLFANSLKEFVKTDDKNSFVKNFKWNLSTFWIQYKLAGKFASYLKAHHYDGSNSVFYSYWLSKSALLLAILKDKGVIDKFVSRAHTVDLYHQHWVINDEVKVPPFKIFKFDNIFRIITISDHGSNFMKEHYAPYADKVKLAYLGISDTDHQPAASPSNGFLIVSCSHLDASKRVDRLAEALTKVSFPCRWVHFGSGIQSEQDKVRAFTHQLPSHVQYELKGHVANEDVHAFYRNNSVDLFVNLSTLEGLPVSIMEAMAHSIPVLATAVYGTPEAVLEQENGFLLDVNFSTAELVNALEDCFGNRTELRQMGGRSYEIFKEKFVAEKNYTEFANYLAQL